MNKLQASMKDASAKRARAGRNMYRVGGYMKGCAHCGDTKEVEGPGGRPKIVFTSGFQVFRSYDPQWVGWTWWCYECGAKDLKCWSPDEAGIVEAMLGKPPIQGTTEAKVTAKELMIKSLPRHMKTNYQVPTRNLEIARLEAEVAKLMAEVAAMAKK
jgi:hypothetical protein